MTLSPARVMLVLLLPAVACSSGDQTGPVPSPAATILALGDRHVCRADSVRTVCWGAGLEGQLGLGVTPVDTVPVEIPDAPAFVSLAAGQSHTCGIDATGAAFCWGSDRDGQLGLGRPGGERCGAFPCVTRPAPVAGSHHFTQLAAGPRYTCGLSVEQMVYCWGLNDVGQLGTSADAEQCEDGRCSREPLAEMSGRRFSSITAGLSYVCGLESGGTAYCWGFQAAPLAGEHTNATFTPVAAPIPGVTFRQLSSGGYHTCGIARNGTSYCWGIDALGAGPNRLEADAPVAVVGGISFASIHAARYTTCGLDENGAAYCWGPNVSGEVGTTPIGTTQRFDEPVSVSGGLRFASLEPGNSTYCGITVEGETACWGRGESGELGAEHANSTTPRTVVIPE